MKEQSDVQLLRAYAETGDEPSFHEVVTRHADLVYSAALRQVESPDLAADTTQRVFTDLARKARPLAASLKEDASLVGWLYRSTRFAALNLRRADRRRVAHEREAMEQLMTDTEPAPNWDHIRPVLDEAMADLNDEDREALLLRFFKDQDFRAVGSALGVSDDAAQKRVSRAVDRLRGLLARRGVAVGAGGLALVLSGQVVHAAPVGMAATITASALSGAGKTGSLVALLKTLFASKVTVAIAGTLIAAAAVAPLIVNSTNSPAPAHRITLHVKNAPLADVIQKLEKQSREKIPCDQKLTGQVTLDVKDASLSEALDLIAPQVGARWSEVHAVYESKASLGELEKSFLAGAEINPDAWTNLAPRMNAFGPGGGFSRMGSPPPGMGGGFRTNSFMTNFVTRSSGPPGAMPEGAHNVTVTRSTSGMVVMGQGGSGMKSEVWYSSRLLLENDLASRLSKEVAPTPSTESAAAVASDVNGKVQTYYVLGKLPKGFAMPSFRPGQTNLQARQDEAMQQLRKMQQERTMQSLSKSPEQQVQEAREHAAQKRN